MVAVKKKNEEEQELLEALAEADVPTSPYERHASIMLERSTAVDKAMKKLDQAMINKAMTLLEASGEGAGDLKIKQIETAIEIYKALQAL
ncbi:hypothetical protein [uncultured Phascolarctobacterium sp.]|uniref:hypothetical protein n=1 Tax=uncultured Phascolarctobacterium sp. TaxID=512296 RepID=UPI0025DE9124|nr:hypothetical protein [uncultured Phascolarctobacterium sp.]